ncbi:PepSY domain-containing protein [Nonomuraea sp. NPDC048916]|uniref:PepSY domain-containing protein n=1 Tax=Nonomuraea sp. NPDC048916 TaxID=3154232 RepID=UPI0033FBC925
MRITKRIIVIGTGVTFLIAGGSAAVAVAATTAPSQQAAATAAAPKVTAEQAIQIAHKQVPGGWIDEVSLDKRGQKPDVWEVELVKGDVEHELDVDAATGKVLKHEQEHVDDSRHRGGSDDHGSDDHGSDDD